MEPPGAQPALGIDAVEWLSTGEQAATVIITGRWRRRPNWHGRPVLVIEAQGHRHRFRATPDPLSLAGATPGTWRISFSIPAWLAPHLSGQAWLQFGGVVVALPAVVESAAGRGSPAVSEPEGATESPSAESPATEDSPAAERPQASEHGPHEIEELARQRADEVLAAAAELGDRIQQLEAERRAAEERVQAEQARCAELEEQHETHLREAARWKGTLTELAAAQARIRDLEWQLADARRRAEEAGEHAGRAEAERDQALRDLEHLQRTPWRDRLSDEIVVMRQAARTVERPAIAVGGVNGQALQQARAQLSRERDVLEASEIERWRRRTADLEQQVRDHALRAERLYDVIEELRSVLDAIRGISPDPVEEQVAFGEDESGADPVVEPLRLDAALARLREEIPPQPETADESEPPVAEEPELPVAEEPELPVADEAELPVADEAELPVADEPEAHPEPPPPTRKSWLLRVLRMLEKEDPATAGRLILDLLPAQRATYPQSLTYDLVLADTGCVSVCTVDGASQVTRSQAPRELGEVDFRLTGELASLARLLTVGRLRRRFGRRMPRVEGKRKPLSGLVSLVRTPLGLSELHAAGVRLDPAMTFTVLALMIDPKWTTGHRFTVAHRGLAEVVYLKVSGEGRPSVGAQPPLGPVATTIVSDPGALLPVLAGENPSGVTIRGTQEPLAVLREWVSLAQRS